MSNWVEDILSQKRKIRALSPMADMTDSAFCQIVRKIGGADIVFREMVSAEALVRDNAKTLGMTDFVPAERPIVQQIFGADPMTMARAAAIVMEHAAPEGIDINMGCPVYKITSNFNGCALMKEPDRAADIIRQMRQAIGDHVPISVKIRLGWSDPDDFKKFIPVIEDAGASLITIHGRTKAQGYSGVSDWKRIAEAKKIARVPLLANGDIHEPGQVAEALAITGADGVLIARGALGNPWFFKQFISRYPDNPDFRINGISESGLSVYPDLNLRIQVVLDHARLHVAQYSLPGQSKSLVNSAERSRGECGMVTFRKHLAWYFKGSRVGIELAGLKELRIKLMQVQTLQELEEILLNPLPFPAGVLSSSHLLPVL